MKAIWMDEQRIRYVKSFMKSTGNMQLQRKHRLIICRRQRRTEADVKNFIYLTS